MKNKIYLLLAMLLPWWCVGQNSGLLWKISGQGMKSPSYLFGTYHTSDGRVIAKADQAMPYLKSCKVYAMELDPNETTNPFKLLNELKMKDNGSLKKLISAEEYRQIDSVFKKHGQSLGLFDRFMPVMAETILESLMVEDDPNAIDTKENAMDLYFAEHAKKMHKKVLGIETVDEQILALTCLSYQEQADMLVATFHTLQTDEGHPDQLMQWYLAGQLDSLLNETDQHEMPEKFYQVIITDRNKRMAERMKSMLQKKASFMAVGAMHLPGETGILALLRSYGYQTEVVW